MLRRIASAPRLWNGRRRSTLLLLCLLFPVPASRLAGQASAKRVITDASTGLVWVADGRHAVTTGQGEDVVLSLADGLALIEGMNRGEIENFGYTDWRLPTERELLGLVDPSRGVPSRVASLNADLLRRLLAPSRRADRTGASSLADLKKNKGPVVVAWPVRGAASLPGFGDVVLFATNSIELLQGVEITSGDVVANDASSSQTLDPRFEVAVGVGSRAPAGFSVQGDSVRLKNRSSVGDVFYNELDSRGTIQGVESTPLALPVFPLLPDFETAAPGSQDVEVGRDDFMELPAGAYADLVIGEGGTLLLVGDSYDFASIRAELGSSLLFTMSSRVRVAERAAVGQSVLVGPDAGAAVSAADLIFFVGGINGGNGKLNASPEAAEIGPDSQVQANFYVPNGTLHLRQNVRAEGAFLARDVLIANGVTLTLDSAFANEPPVAQDDTFTTDEDTSLAGNLLIDNGNGADSDPDGDPLTVIEVDGSSLAIGVPVSLSSGAELTVHSDGTFTYDPAGAFDSLASGESFVDSFTYTIDDGNDATDTATVTVTVTGVDDVPLAEDDAYATDEDTVLEVTSPGVLANDSDPEGGPLSVIAFDVQSELGATVSVAVDGGLSYDPTAAPELQALAEGELVEDRLAYTVSDGAQSSSATVFVTVAGVNDLPQVAGETFETVGNTLLEVSPASGTLGSGPRVFVAGSLLANDTDVDGPAPLTASLVSQATAAAEITVQPDGSFTYISAPGAVGMDGFDYAASDGAVAVNASVVVDLEERIWYVRNDGGGGQGRSSDPFATLAAAETAAAAGDHIFVFAGDGTSSGQDAGIALRDGQKLIGEAAGLTLDLGLNGNPTPTELVAPGPRPRIENTAGAGVTVLADAVGGGRSGVVVQGLEVGATAEAISVRTLDTESADLAIVDNVLASSGGAALAADGSGGSGVLVITDLSDNVVSAATGGGLALNSVLFDADLGAADAQTVDAGTTRVGDLGDLTQVSGDGVRLDGVRGGLSFASLEVGNSAGTGLFVRDADGKLGTFALVIGGGTVSTSGGAALDVDPVTMAVVLEGVASANAPGAGLLLDGVAGSFQVTGQVDIDNAGTNGVEIAFSSAAVSLASLDVDVAGGDGLAVVEDLGNVTVGTGEVASALGAGVRVSGGAGNVAYGASITNGSGPSVMVENRTGGAVTFAGDVGTSGTPNTGSGVQVVANTGGSVDFTGAVHLSTGTADGVSLLGNPGATVSFVGGLSAATTTGTALLASGGGTVTALGVNALSTSGGTGLEVTDTAIGAGGLSFDTITVDGLGTAANGVRLSNSGAGSLAVALLDVDDTTGAGLSLSSVSGAVSIPAGDVSGAAGPAVEIQGGSAAVAFGATIHNVAGRSVQVTGTGGGTIAFGGAIDDDGGGIFLDGNGAGAISFGGGLDLETGTHDAFTATNGGTVEVTGSNRVTTTGGRGVRLSGVTIAPSGVTFESVSTAGAPNGIVLVDTGMGPFSVTGDGASDPTDPTRGRTIMAEGGGALTLGSGGTIEGSSGPQVVLDNAHNVTLRNLVVRNTAGAVDDGRDGIDLVNGSSDILLDNVLVTGHSGNHGIDGESVSGLTLLHSEISGNATSPGVEGPGVHNVRFDDVSGAVSIQSSLMHTSRESVFTVANATGVATIDISNCEIRDTDPVAPGNAGLDVRLSGNAQADVTVSSSTFLRNRARSLRFAAVSGSAGGSLTAHDNAFEDSFVHLDVAHQTAGQTVRFDIADNVLNQNAGVLGESTAVNVVLGGASAASTLLAGTIRGNVIGNAALSGSGSFEGAGIAVVAQGAGTLTTQLFGNTVRAIRQDSALVVQSIDHSGALNLTLGDSSTGQGNVFDATPGAFPLYGIDLLAGAVPTDSGTLRVHFAQPSTATGDALAKGIGLLTAAGTPAVELQGYAGLVCTPGPSPAGCDAAVAGFLDGANVTAPAPADVFVSAGQVTGSISAPGGTVPLP